MTAETFKRNGNTVGGSVGRVNMLTAACADRIIGIFDVTSRDGYLDSFDCLEQAVIQVRNETFRETAKAFLKEVGKKRKT